MVELTWAREMMDAAHVSAKDIAQVWDVSETSVHRWLDGKRMTNISLKHAMWFSRLVQRPLEEIAVRLVEL